MKLDNYDLVAQMFLVGIKHKEDIPSVISLIKNYSIGGVLIYRSCFSNLKEYKSLINKLYNANKNNNLPLFIAVDEEGGRVNRLPSEFVNIPPAFQLEKYDDEIIKKIYYLMSNNLRNLGFNMNLAPVLDLKFFDDSHYLGNRAISSSPKRVCEVADIIMSQSAKNNIIPVAKHFPGIGSVKTDSHIFLPKLKSYQKDIIPFKHIINNKCDALLISHVRIKNKTGIYPASLSRKFIQTELRGKLKYNGLIITDELRMRSVSIFFGYKRAIKLALTAGNDVLCIKYYKGNIEKYIKMGANLIEKGKIDLRASYQRIKDVKKKYHLKDVAYFDDIDVDDYNNEMNKLCSTDVK